VTGDLARPDLTMLELAKAADRVSLNHFPTAPPMCHESAMEQFDIEPRNRGERIRKRAWQAMRRGNLSGYQKLAALALEAPTIRDTSDWRDAF
jgi:hypothetical protein